MSIPICEKLEAIDEEAMYQAPASTHATVNEAAAIIRDLVTALENFIPNADVAAKRLHRSGFHDHSEDLRGAIVTARAALSRAQVQG